MNHSAFIIQPDIPSTMHFLCFILSMFGKIHILGRLCETKIKKERKPTQFILIIPNYETIKRRV